MADNQRSSGGRILAEPDDGEQVLRDWEAQNRDVDDLREYERFEIETLLEVIPIDKQELIDKHAELDRCVTLLHALQRNFFPYSATLSPPKSL